MAPEESFLESYCIGTKLRQLRTSKSLNLSRFAALTGFSIALLSKLENDRIAPTLSTLAAICRACGVGLSYFFSEPERHTVSITRKTHMERSKRKQECAQTIPLSVAGPNLRLHADLMELTPGAPTSLNGHDGETCAFVFVLEGRLQFNSGSTTETLESGDCACVDSAMVIAWSTGNKEHCRFLVVRPGERSTVPPLDVGVSAPPASKSGNST